MTKAQRFKNRELSWLDFNYRVLSEARDKQIPLMERLKFLSITASNLDEFFMIRVASLKDQVNAGYTKTDISGMTAQEQINAILDETHRFAIEYHKQIRSKTQVHSILDDIPMIGATRRKALMRTYQSLAEIQKADVEELMEIPEMNRQAAESVVQFFAAKQREGERDDKSE